ncbi:MAG: N-acetylmuramoyl-L-alanine amidase [Prevotella sp.]|nr:N-acetylmuramoyl-L-alanine amidase [Prevotella sp.]
MRRITLIILHCSATPPSSSLSFEACRKDHIEHRGFKDIGYHYYITRDGVLHHGRPEHQVGAHCKNHNRHSIGICYEGGIDENGKPADTRTPEQLATWYTLLSVLQHRYPHALIVKHRDLNPQKECPGF